MASEAFQQVTSEFGIDGGINTGNLQFLKDNFRSVLYLCPDSATDSGAEGGFAAVDAAFPGAAMHKPLTTDCPALQLEPNQTLLAAVHAFEAYRTALDSLPRPTVIICKTARRASAVLAAYMGVRDKKTVDEVVAQANALNLKFVGTPGLLRWVSVVVGARGNTGPPLMVRQLFELSSSTYTYLIADPVSKEALLIDPVLETVERDTKLVCELGLNLKYAINTHVHADHVTGTWQLKQRFPGCQSAVSEVSTGDADIKLHEYDRLNLGSRSIFCLSTPGHTVGCFTYVLDDMSAVFTGDALLIRGCGRTDFQGGSAATLYRSVHDKIFVLPESTIVYTGHDYNGFSQSTVGEEKRLNPRLTKSLEEFEGIMAGLNLAYPMKIEYAVPFNFKCGFGAEIPTK